MKRWIAVVCAILVCATLAGCAEPRVSVTDASARRVEFLVQNAWLAPEQDMDEQAASHCRRHGLSYRQTDAVWVSPTLKRIAYECGPVEPSLTRKPEVRHRPVQTAHSTAAVKPASSDPKAAAWTKVKAAADAWALCLRLDAERRAKETVEAPQSIVQEVVDTCSGLEHAVHEPLEAVGEDSGRFQADLHARAVQDARNTVTSARTKTDVSVSGAPAF